MKVSVRKSCYVADGAKYDTRYDALFFSESGARQFATVLTKGGAEFNKPSEVGALSPKDSIIFMSKRIIADGYTKNERPPKLDSSDEYIEINV
jgi:hypothetical protein